MKKQIFLVSLLSVLLLTGCGANPQKSDAPSGSSAAPVEEPEILIPDEIPEEQPENDIHTELQWDYISDPDWTNVKAYIPTTGASGKDLGDLSAPRGSTLEFGDVEDGDKYYIEVSESRDFTNVREFESSEKYVTVYNFEIGRKYYYRAAVSEEALAEAEVKEYRVYGAAPRNLYIPGVKNFRDVGGWKSSLVEGAHINQGLYYRCAQLDRITDEGKAEIKRLGIKVDIDMRDSYSVPSKSPATSDDWEVTVLKGSVASGTESGRWEGDHASDHNIAATYKTIFEAIAESDEAPIALHCKNGADRTGIVTFFLLALCGVSAEDCGREYMITRYAGERDVWHEDEFDKWVSKTEALEGESFAEKTYNHMRDAFGIEEDTLETIRELFVPGYERP